MMSLDGSEKTADLAEADRKKLAGLLGFAEGVLNARSKVQMVMQAGLGVFHEADFTGLPGVSLQCDDGAWLRLLRQRETRPPEPEAHVESFLVARPSDPAKRPLLKPAISVEVSIEEASDLEEGGLLEGEDVHPIVENGVELENRVKVILHAENCPEMRRDFEAYVAGPWSDWAAQEKPVRKAIALYNDLFKIHSVIHTSEGTPPELVWGIGIARWAVAGQRIDMPVIEQMVDIEIEDGGAISIRPRDLAPHLSLKPYLEAEIDGSPKLQRELQERLSQILLGDVEFSPFTTVCEPILDTAASNLCSTGHFVSRAEIEDGETIHAAGEDLRITATWALFGRPRSHEARAQDLSTLRKQVENPETEVPSSIRGFAAPPPAEPARDISDFGLDSAVLGGAVTQGWEPSATGGASPGGKGAGSSGSSRVAADEGRKVHFFPLPFNEEQGRISDLIDAPKSFVTCVSGPPGTGKSHSIANIISHQMAMGKRVLVTARTPEAIAAVREKLPESLQPLVIASVGTDRESAQQLEHAVTELSREVVGLNVEDALADKARFEADIVECDRIAEKADADLARIARANLSPLEWQGGQHAPMELVEILAEQAPDHAWFEDRPKNAPPAQIEDVLARLRSQLPELASDIVYAGSDLPRPEELPATAELIAAHETELAWHQREIVDYSTAPAMARDAADAEARAREVLATLVEISTDIEGMSESSRELARLALLDEGPIGRAALESLKGYLDRFEGLAEIMDVHFARGACDAEAFLHAVSRGAAGQKPIGFSLFKGDLKAAIDSVRRADLPPSNSDDWGAVLKACRLEEKREDIAAALDPMVGAGHLAGLPQEPAAMAAHIELCRREIAEALRLAAALGPVIETLRDLFPYGLDLEALRRNLECGPAIFAIRGNLPDDYVSPRALTALRAIAGPRELPVLCALSDLAEALGDPDTAPADIVAARGEITRELTRLAEVAPRLEALGRDLDALSAAGAPRWVETLKARPETAPELIPEAWRLAWDWAVMTGRVEDIVALGNGDALRQSKAEAAARRRKAFEALIRTRTLLGLKRRMTAPIRQAMEAFTQAISKIGTGKGKRAPRFIRAAQEAAKEASAAAPVWIMPEYKIPEQLPAEFGDFDLVILDEASQSDVTALAALARGKKILVVGDEEQVSPSVVGIADQKINALRAEFLDGLPNAGLIDQNASIFEITKRMHPDAHVMLREHFRCVAPIIQFSTRFYNNALVPLRVPRASERFDPPLADVYLPGATRQGKTNAFEARWIVDEIARLIEDPAHAGRDIGVISLIGGEQAEKIGRMLVEDPRIGPEKIEERRIIYGDARTMQGQERSIVFLSMVATPGSAHAQTTKADQQRVNVAMSRAKDRLYLVRSVSLEDLRPNDIKAQILHHFADPMPDGRAASYAEIEDLLDRCGSGFEREVLGKLMEAGYRVRPQVAAGGFRIDLVVEGNEDRRLAIELDGDRYHGPEVWDRDMARQAALERAGWVFWRVFGSQWRANPDYWWDDLVGTLERLGIAPIGAAAVDERFTETILVDLGAGPETASEGDDVSDVESEPPGEPVAQAGVENGVPEEDGTGAAQEQEVADVPRESEQVSEPAAAPEPAELRVPEAPRKRGRDSQQVLPLEDDLFSRLVEIQSVRPEPETPVNGAAVEEDESRSRPRVQVGTTVRIEKLGRGGGKLEITLVDSGHDADHGLIGIHTPLGQALLDAEIGDEVEYRAGAYIQEVRVLDVA